MANLTYKQIDSWQKNVSKAVNTNLVSSLKKISNSAAELQTITASASGDADQLSYRFKDLSALSKTAASRLKQSMEGFEKSMDEYLKAVKSAENKAAAQARKPLDQFAEVAAQIAKITL